MNNALYKNGMERINNDALATLTILVASSRPEDKEIMMQLIKKILSIGIKKSLLLKEKI